MSPKNTVIKGTAFSNLSALTLLLIAYTQWSCTTSYQVTADNFDTKSEAIERESEHHRAEIRTIENAVVMHGEMLRFENDSLFWKNPNTNALKNKALADIGWIQFRDYDKGGTEGFRKGALVGTSIGLVGGFIVFAVETGWYWAIPLSIVSAAIYGVGGAAVGFVGGRIRGYHTRYIMNFPDP